MVTILKKRERLQEQLVTLVDNPCIDYKTMVKKANEINQNIEELGL